MRLKLVRVAAAVAGAAFAGGALAQAILVEGAVTQQTIGTFEGSVRSERRWIELVSAPLSCIAGRAISADAGIQLRRGSGPVRVRVVARPYAEGESFPRVVLAPGAVTVTRETASAFPFGGSVPDGVEVALLSLQVRPATHRDAIVNKASLRLLWDRTPPPCG